MKKVAIDFAITQLETIEKAMKMYHTHITNTHINRDTKINSIERILCKLEDVLIDNAARQRGVKKKSYTAFRGEGINKKQFKSLQHELKEMFVVSKITLQHDPIYSKRNGHGEKIIVVFDNDSDDMWVVAVNINNEKQCYIQ